MSGYSDQIPPEMLQGCDFVKYVILHPATEKIDFAYQHLHVSRSVLTRDEQRVSVLTAANLGGLRCSTDAPANANGSFNPRRDHLRVREDGRVVNVFHELVHVVEESGCTAFDMVDSEAIAFFGSAMYNYWYGRIEVGPTWTESLARSRLQQPAEWRAHDLASSLGLFAAARPVRLTPAQLEPVRDGVLDNYHYWSLNRQIERSPVHRIFGNRQPNGFSGLTRRLRKREGLPDRRAICRGKNNK